MASHLGGDPSRDRARGRPRWRGVPRRRRGGAGAGGSHHVGRARAAATAGGFALDHLQSNHEGELVDAIGASRSTHAAIVINPGAFTHYSWAIHDALASFEGPIVELHLSNPQTRESWRHTSVVTPVATALVAGLGGAGYRVAVEAALELATPTTPE